MCVSHMHTNTHKLGVEVASLPNHEDMQWETSGGWISLLGYTTCNINHEKYDHLLDIHDNISFIFKFPPRTVSTNVFALVFTRE